MILKFKDKGIKLVECKSFYNRFRGFMFTKNIDKALMFKKCNSIHTCFMKNNIDIIMCNKDYKVIKYYPDFGKWKFILPQKDVYLTIETPRLYFDIKVGDVMEVKK